LRLLLVSSTGGHLLQLVALREAWDGFERVWVTFDAADSRALLAGEQVVHAHGPTNRNVPNLLRNLVLAWRVVREVRPGAVVTTGAGVAVPFAWVGRLFGARVVYVESLTRIEGPSLTYRLIRPVVSRTYVQWPELRLRGALYRGTVFDRA
jgi:UDP-N-acetylglucosamine:LPS N-acetylglucosamine transferase